MLSAGDVLVGLNVSAQIKGISQFEHHLEVFLAKSNATDSSIDRHIFFRDQKTGQILLPAWVTEIKNVPI